MDLEELVTTKLKQLQVERSHNRCLRANSKKSNFYLHPSDDLNTFINSELPLRPTYNEFILPVFYSSPPSSPKITREPSTLLSLSFLYPIGHLTYSEKSPDEWYIVSEAFHTNRLFEYVPEWESKKAKIYSIIYHSTHLLNYLSKFYCRDLPYPLIIEGQSLKISKSEFIFDLINFEKPSNMKVAVALLCADAAYLSGGPEKDLLPNLASLLHLPKIPNIQESNLTVSIYDAPQNKTSFV